MGTEVPGDLRAQDVAILTRAGGERRDPLATVDVEDGHIKDQPSPRPRAPRRPAGSRRPRPLGQGRVRLAVAPGLDLDPGDLPIRTVPPELPAHPLGPPMGERADPRPDPNGAP